MPEGADGRRPAGPGGLVTEHLVAEAGGTLPAQAPTASYHAAAQDGRLWLGYVLGG